MLKRLVANRAIRRFKWTNQCLARYLATHTMRVRSYMRLTTISMFLIHSGEVSIETRFGLVIGRLHEGEIFIEVGHSCLVQERLLREQPQNA